MKKLLSILLAAVTANTAMAQVVAFPGAEGFGKYATGGRGGKVYYVTRNDDCTDANLVEGTLRWALRTGDDTPRTILFKTCGTIYLNSPLKFAHPNVSIEGQTAPGGGVCIAGYRVYVCRPNVILRHLRFRAGDLAAKSSAALDVENTHHVIIDHCSITWSMEECLTMYDCDSTTVQWCIIGEALYNSRNAKGARSYAAQWGGEHGTMHHTLITNCNSRMPRFNGVRSESTNPGDHDQYVDSEFFNNVIFNWGKSNSLYGGECYTAINGGNNYNRVYVRNNYFRPGPNTQMNVKKNRYFFQGDNSTAGTGQWLVDGNVFETGCQYAYTSNNCWKDATLELVNANNWYGFTTGSSDRGVNLGVGCTSATYNKYALTEQTVKSGLEPTSAKEAFEAVTSLNGAGASLPRYDEVDTRLLLEASGGMEPQFSGYTDGAVSRGIGIINSQNDVVLSKHDTFTALHETTGQGVGDLEEITAWPWLGMEAGEKYVTDTDGDGLPDGYETEQGFNPNDAADGALIGQSGYSNLEQYLNGVADGTIDKTKYETTTTAIAAVEAEKKGIATSRSYTLGGAAAANNGKGVVIVKEANADGTVTTTKRLLR